MAVMMLADMLFVVTPRLVIARRGKAEAAARYLSCQLFVGIYEGQEMMMLM